MKITTVATRLVTVLLYTIGINALLLKEHLKRKTDAEISSTLNATDNDQKFQVFRITPQNDDEIKLLNELYRKNADFQLDFWKAPTSIGEFVDIMVGPEFRNAARKFLDERNIHHTVIIDDVQRLIIQREKLPVRKPPTTSSSNSLLMSFFSKRMKDDSAYSSRNRAKYVFGEYHSYDEMLRWLADIELFYPHLAQVFTIGQTYEKRPIRGIKIGNPINDVTKRAIWIDGGMHAREWASIHTALYFIDQLISLYGVDAKITSYVDTLNFYIVPVANPDGFEYSRSDITPHTRFWRKNRGLQRCNKDQWRRERCCGGVDLNRNFDFHWGETGSSGDLCSDIFQGTSAFSEAESRAIRDKILSPELDGRLDAFITLHTYSQMWIHPYSHVRKSFPEDINELQMVGKQGVDAIKNVYGTDFRFGTGADMLYPSAGGSDDWAKAHAKVKFVYLLELRPGDGGLDGFLLDRRQLIPTGRETWEGVKVVIDAVMRNNPGVSSLRFPAIPSSGGPVPMFTQMSPLSSVPSTTTQPQMTVGMQRQTLLIRSQLQQNPEIVATKNGTTVLSHPSFEVNRRGQQIAPNQNQQRTGILRHEYEQRLQQEQNRQLEHRRQILFWQNQQNRLHAGCVDRSPWCSGWIRASPRVCETSIVYMQQDCRSSCGFCASPVS